MKCLVICELLHTLRTLALLFEGMGEKKILMRKKCKTKSEKNSGINYTRGLEDKLPACLVPYFLYVFFFCSRVTIKLKDINDNAPVFQQEVPSVTTKNTKEISTKSFFP